MNRWSYIACALVALLGVLLWRHIEAGPDLFTQGTVSRVVDGDTYIVSAGSRSERVRIIGIDTPEVVDPDKPVQCYGPQASAYAKHWLTGRRVRLSYDVVRHDVYGRVLAYVTVDGPPSVSVEERMLRLGYARTLTIPPNDRNAAHYARLQSEAATAGKGLWGACG
jgi:micrococcal nuclease